MLDGRTGGEEQPLAKDTCEANIVCRRVGSREIDRRDLLSSSGTAGRPRIRRSEIEIEWRSRRYGVGSLIHVGKGVGARGICGGRTIDRCTTDGRSTSQGNCHTGNTPFGGLAGPIIVAIDVDSA